MLFRTLTNDQILATWFFKCPIHVFPVSVVTILIFLTDFLLPAPILCFTMRPPFNPSYHLIQIFMGSQLYARRIFKKYIYNHNIPLPQILWKFSIVLRIKHNTINKVSKPCTPALSLQHHIKTLIPLSTVEALHTTPGMSSIFSSFWSLQPLPGMFFSTSSSSQFLIFLKILAWTSLPAVPWPGCFSYYSRHSTCSLLWPQHAYHHMLDIHPPTGLMKVALGPVLSTHHICQQCWHKVFSWWGINKYFSNK